MEKEEYIQRFYRSLPGWMDGNQEFWSLLERFIIQGSRVLELGPGEGSVTTRFVIQNISTRVTGLDTDEAARKNPYLSEMSLYDGTHFPFEAGVFDAVLADYVMEHVRTPELVIKEIGRILKKGGVFCFRTSNKWHYVSILSRILPSRISTWSRGRSASHRVYKKFFRCNTESQCRKLLARAGLTVLEIRLIEKEPSYGMRSPLLFFPMMAYERFVNSCDAFSFLKANILCVAKKEK